MYGVSSEWENFMDTKDQEKTIFGLTIFTYTHENASLWRMRKETILCGFPSSILETVMSTVGLRDGEMLCLWWRGQWETRERDHKDNQLPWRLEPYRQWVPTQHAQAGNNVPSLSLSLFLLHKWIYVYCEWGIRNLPRNIVWIVLYIGAPVAELAGWGGRFAYYSPTFENYSDVGYVREED